MIRPALPPFTFSTILYVFEHLVEVYDRMRHSFCQRRLSRLPFIRMWSQGFPTHNIAHMCVVCVCVCVCIVCVCVCVCDDSQLTDIGVHDVYNRNTVLWSR